MRRRLWVITGFIFSLLLGGCAKEGPPVYSGTIEGVEVPILSEIGGAVQQLHIDEGNSIQKGDVLAVLDHRVLNQQVKEAEAAVELAQAALDDTKAGPRDQELTKLLY